MEEMILPEKKKENPNKEVFKLTCPVDEFDMVIYASKISTVKFTKSSTVQTSWR